MGKTLLQKRRGSHPEKSFSQEPSRNVAAGGGGKLFMLEEHQLGQGVSSVKMSSPLQRHPGQAPSAPPAARNSHIRKTWLNQICGASLWNSSPQDMMMAPGLDAFKKGKDRTRRRPIQVTSRQFLNARRKESWHRYPVDCVLPEACDGPL